MNITITKSDERKINFVLEADVAFANALRRIALNEVPTMAIEIVDIEENNSGLFDEILAHRLGLIPLKFNQKLFNFKDDCKCKGEGCTRCEATLSLEVDGPYMVTAKELSGDLEAADPNIPIVELLEGQRLKLTAIAQLGMGKDHSKWQASIAAYRNKPIVKIKQGKDAHGCDEVCPTNVFEKKDGKVKVAREDDCILCMKCVEVSEDVSVTADQNSFIFNIETVSGLSAKQILETALDIIEERSENFASTLKKELK